MVDYKSFTPENFRRVKDDTASPLISQLQNMRRSSDTEQCWRQRLFCCRT